MINFNPSQGLGFRLRISGLCCIFDNYLKCEGLNCPGYQYTGAWCKSSSSVK